MGVSYQSIIWNGFKKKYDLFLLVFVIVSLFIFSISQSLFHPTITLETIIVRGTALTAFFLLHIILSIGPLTRIDRRFLPILYNRRHLGVTMFLLALFHAVFCMIQFHSLGDVNPIYSIFGSNTRYSEISRFPFQILGFCALIILLFMAITSHDFWLKNLTPRIWKSLHMGVYVAYVLLVFHVLFGTLEYESHYFYKMALGIGVLTVAGLHLYTGILEWKKMKNCNNMINNGFHAVTEIDGIKEGKGLTVYIDGVGIAVFRHNNTISAVSNVCKHQLGPLGEGQILDGCITCPWHGYQYFPHNGQSPPPFTEKIKTFQVMVVDNKIWVNPAGLPEGTYIEPVKL